MNDTVQHSKPIPISTQHLRHRSTSFSSDSSSSSASSPPLLTPANFPTTRNIPVSSSSPILQFLSQSSPSKAAATFPFRGFVPPPLAEDEQAEERPTHTHHARRASAASRFQPQQSPVLEPHHERGVNVLRRLSLSGHLVKPPGMDMSPPGNPQPPPKPPTPIKNAMQPNRKARRSAIVTEHMRRRAPSPMGERILKGHFDGFN